MAWAHVEQIVKEPFNVTWLKEEQKILSTFSVWSESNYTQESVSKIQGFPRAADSLRRSTFETSTLAACAVRFIPCAIPLPSALYVNAGGVVLPAKYMTSSQ